MDNETPPCLLTKKEVARDLRISVRTLENLMNARMISFIKIGSAIRFESSELDRLKKRHTVEVVAS